MYQAEGNLLFVFPLPRSQVKGGFAMAKSRINKPIGDKGYGFVQTEEGEESSSLNEEQGVENTRLVWGAVVARRRPW